MGKYTRHRTMTAQLYRDTKPKYLHLITRGLLDILLVQWGCTMNVGANGLWDSLGRTGRVWPMAMYWMRSSARYCIQRNYLPMRRTIIYYVDQHLLLTGYESGPSTLYRSKLHLKISLKSPSLLHLFPCRPPFKRPQHRRWCCLLRGFGLGLHSLAVSADLGELVLLRLCRQFICSRLCQRWRGRGGRDCFGSCGRCRTLTFFFWGPLLLLLLLLSSYVSRGGWRRQ